MTHKMEHTNHVTWNMEHGTTKMRPSFCSMLRVPCSMNRGFTIVELIITIAILSFGIIGAYGAFSSIAVLNYNASMKFTAAYLAQEGLEITKNIRDNSFLDAQAWSQNLVNCSLGCQADYKTKTASEAVENQLKAYDDNVFLNFNGDGFYSYDNGTATKFKRKITITEESADNLKVVILIMWDYNGQPYSFETTGYLYNWF